ncbi:hypothetical protein [Anaerocolumna sp. MB42-C2]|uniref:hypothetical protein n=1 Tax=Anaerocolumna sp. MB42-C2 TaxID=3070997 RepID=UPI0027E1F130|nr:hypothetical protein [Anaerocolumna sp. MB42-C2]WMJ87370.1 hypothetical protein RBU59_25585 [Anaerocolumna sp. MB42-C2]
MVYSNSYAANEKMEKTQDVADMNYSQNLTEEELQMHKLINESIYKEVEESLKPYCEYGLSYNSNENQLYFNNNPIKCFVDNTATDGSFYGTEHHCEAGVGGVITKRDTNGNITELTYLDDDKLDEYLSTGWKTSSK